MRKNLFKAKKSSDGKWVKGSLVNTPFGTFIEWYEDSICNEEEVDPSTVCQFTGLTDCEGNEIWEGDLLQIHIKAAIYEVVWYEKIGGFVIKVYTTDKSSPNLLGYELQTYKYKIVGNKFDKEK